MTMACGTLLAVWLAVQEAPLPQAPTALTLDPVSPADESPMLEVRVVGTRLRPPSAAGDFRLKVPELLIVPRTSAESLLSLAPGLLLSNEGGEGHPSAIFLRGFNAGEGQDVEIVVDGVPLNEPSNLHAHGRASSHFLIPELVSELRVLEGPFDARQGDFAVAGSAEYTLGLNRRGLTTKTGFGSFGRRRVAMLYGPDNTGPGTFIGVDVTQGAGFGPNRAHAAGRVLARHEVQVGANTVLALSAQSYAARFDSAGVIRDDDFRARALPCGLTSDEQFFCLYDGNQGEAASRHSLSTKLNGSTAEGRWESQVFVTLQQSRVRQNVTGFLNDIANSDLPQRGDGVEQTHDAMTIGARGGYRQLRGLPSWLREVEGGYAFRHDDADAVQRRLRTVGGVPYRVDNNDRLQLTNLAFFVQARGAVGARMHVSAGMRADAHLFGVQDRNRPASDRIGSRETSEAFEAYGLAFLPKLALNYALADSLSLLASYGVGTRSSQAQGLSDGEIAPFARVNAGEIGLSLNKIIRSELKIDARAIAFHTRVERDLVFDEARARNVTAGASNRMGGLVFLQTSLPKGFNLLSSATYTEAYLPPVGTEWYNVLSGPRLPYVPRWVLRGDVVYRRAFGSRNFVAIGSGVTYVAPRPLPHEQLSPYQLSWDSSVHLGSRAFDVGLEVMNVLDRRNREAVFNYPSNFRGPDEPVSRLPAQHFSAGSPRTILFTLTAQLGGNSL